MGWLTVNKGCEDLLLHSLRKSEGDRHWGGQMPGYCPPASGYTLRNRPHPTFNAAIPDTFHTFNFEPWPGFEPATSQARGKALPIEPQDLLQEPEF
ncbi:hypothetical protein C0J45_9266 [Silurus meridionalis]|nr:hypothetical protein C0J45_9266 [Silurus meridionalis]